MNVPVEVGCVGHAPTITIAPADPEARKYTRMWDRPEYRAVSPGEGIAPLFVAQAHLKAGARVIDFGAGTGRGALMIALLGNAHVTMIDFAENCLDEDMRNALVTQAHALRFVKADLRKPIPETAPYGFCADVMEHIAPEDVDTVLANILKSAQHVFFQISTVPDVMGDLIGEPLHLTVQPFEWWAKKFADFDCVVHWAEDFGIAACFYVSAWQTGKEIAAAGILNVSIETVKDQVRRNLEDGWAQVVPHVTQETEVMLLGGGPSLGQFYETIWRMRGSGAKLVTTNGAYNWCVGRGIPVSAQIVVDAREFNARFTHPVMPDTKYLIASQVHPSTLEGLPKDRTLLWHTTAESIRDVLDEKCKVWFGIPGGSTVMLRAIPLLRMLGYYRFHLFGFDSCVTDDHHAYGQPENDDDPLIDVFVEDRAFKATAWMISQAQEFMDLIKFMGNELELAVYGDGLIAHLLNTGAKLAPQEE